MYIPVSALNQTLQTRIPRRARIKSRGGDTPDRLDCRHTDAHEQWQTGDTQEAQIGSAAKRHTGQDATLLRRQHSTRQGSGTAIRANKGRRMGGGGEVARSSQQAGDACGSAAHARDLGERRGTHMRHIHYTPIHSFPGVITLHRPAPFDDALRRTAFKKQTERPDGRQMNGKRARQARVVVRGVGRAGSKGCVHCGGQRGADGPRKPGWLVGHGPFPCSFRRRCQACKYGPLRTLPLLSGLSPATTIKGQQAKPPAIGRLQAPHPAQVVRACVVLCQPKVVGAQSCPATSSEPSLSTAPWLGSASKSVPGASPLPASYLS